VRTDGEQLNCHLVIASDKLKKYPQIVFDATSPHTREISLQFVCFESSILGITSKQFESGL